MNRDNFIDQLKKSLQNLPEEERAEIIYDYEEHFRIGSEEGKSEEEIARQLGDIKNITRQYSVDSTLNNAEKNYSVTNIFKAVIAAASLGFFNLVFVLGPFAGLLGVLAGLFGAAIGITVGGIAGFFIAIFSPLFPAYIVTGVNVVFSIFVSIGLTAFGLLFFIGDCYMAIFFYKVTVRYLKWNRDIIISRRENK